MNAAACRRVVPALAALLLCGCAAHGPALTLSEESPHTLLITGLDDRALAAAAALDAGGRAAFLQVRVKESPTDAPALGGDYVRKGPSLVFTPRYPFRPDVAYQARADLSVVMTVAAPITGTFVIPAPPPGPATRITAIYPTAGELPENLLKFYIEFSAPMSRGEAYRQIRLLDEAGTPVAYPFLELGEELWNPDMTRFTLLFDPGRVKQGLVPRMELGPPLVAGRTYTLEVNAAWHDGADHPLAGTLRKTFRAVPADARQPDPERWRITPPPAGSTGALVVGFDEPLDLALLQRTVTVLDAAGRPLEGRITIGSGEAQWSFQPVAPWQGGRHTLQVQTILEDNAGNSVGRPFEVDLNAPPRPAVPPQIALPFTINAF